MSDTLFSMIDNIKVTTEQAELDVLMSLSDAYIKEYQMIQEGEILDQAKGNDKESMVKRILLFLPRLIKAIFAKFFSKSNPVDKHFEQVETAVQSMDKKPNADAQTPPSQPAQQQTVAKQATPKTTKQNQGLYYLGLLFPNDNDRHEFSSDTRMSKMITDTGLSQVIDEIEKMIKSAKAGQPLTYQNSTLQQLNISSIIAKTGTMMDILKMETHAVSINQSNIANGVEILKEQYKGCKKAIARVINNVNDIINDMNALQAKGTVLFKDTSAYVIVMPLQEIVNGFQRFLSMMSSSIDTELKKLEHQFGISIQPTENVQNNNPSERIVNCPKCSKKIKIKGDIVSAVKCPYCKNTINRSELGRQLGQS